MNELPCGYLQFSVFCSWWIRERYQGLPATGRFAAISGDVAALYGYWPWYSPAATVVSTPRWSLVYVIDHKTAVMNLRDCVPEFILEFPSGQMWVLDGGKGHRVGAQARARGMLRRKALFDKTRHTVPKDKMHEAAMRVLQGGDAW